MKITVDIPESDLREICELTGIHKKGPAIRKLLSDSIMMQRRVQISQKFLSGEWSAGLEGYESAKEEERQSAQNLSAAWQD